MFKLCLLIVAAVALVGPQAVKGQLVGAEDAAHGEFPYHVLLKAGDKFFCSGGLITRKHVLTAGHCIASSYKLRGVVSAVVGTHECNRGGQSYGIVRRFLEPNYVKKTHLDWNFDIGLFQLASHVVLSEHVSLVKLPSSDVQVGTMAVISASGCLKFNGPMSPVVQKLTVRVIDQSTCQSMMMHPIIIHDTYICTFVGVGRGTCQGDSGAPLVHDGVIIGVSSGGVPCARGFPDIFTNVYRYMDWITHVLQIGINTNTTATPGK